MRITASLAALAATFVVASPAFAQTVSDTATAKARGVVLQSHQLVNATALDFGIVAGDPTLAGTVSIDADGIGARSVTGGVVALPSSYQAAKFDGLAAPAETVVLTLTQPAAGVLQDAAGDQITANLVLDSNGTNRTADASGNFVVYVGGTFDIAAAQPSGVYSADFSLTAEYQ